MSADHPADKVLAAIERAAPEPAVLSIENVPLIEMHRDRKMYEWRTRASSVLGAPADI